MPLFQNESKCETIHENENEFDLNENGPVGGTHFHKNGFALRLVLTAEAKGNSEMAYYDVARITRYNNHKRFSSTRYFRVLCRVIKHERTPSPYLDMKPTA